MFYIAIFYVWYVLWVYNLLCIQYTDIWSEINIVVLNYWCNYNSFYFIFFVSPQRINVEMFMLLLSVSDILLVFLFCYSLTGTLYVYHWPFANLKKKKKKSKILCRFFISDYFYHANNVWPFPIQFYLMFCERKKKMCSQSLRILDSNLMNNNRFYDQFYHYDLILSIHLQLVFMLIQFSYK